MIITTLIMSNNLLIIQCQVIKSPPNVVTCLLCLRHNVVSGHNSEGMAIITSSSYLHAGLLKCPLLNTTPLKGAENWRLTIIPVFSQVTSRPVICGMLAGPPWAPATPPSMRRLWRRDWIWLRETWNIVSRVKWVVTLLRNLILPELTVWGWRLLIVSMCFCSLCSLEIDNWDKFKLQLRKYL